MIPKRCVYILLLVVLGLNTLRAEKAPWQELLLNDDSLFDEQNFRDSFSRHDFWSLGKRNKYIRLGDVSQYPVWAGTQRQFDLGLTYSLGVEQVSVADSNNIDRRVLILRFDAEGLSISGSYLAGSSWKNGLVLDLNRKHSVFSSVVMPDGSGLLVFAPRSAKPQRQAAALVCVTPFYKHLRFKKGAVLPEATVEKRARFGSLGFAVAYDMQAEYFSGEHSMPGVLRLFTESHYSEEDLAFVKVSQPNPELALKGVTSADQIRELTLSSSVVGRAEVVGQAMFEASDGRRGIFLKHKILEIHPVTPRLDLESLKWVQQYLLAKEMYNQVPYDELGQCAYIVTYTVDREIYEKQEK